MMAVARVMPRRWAHSDAKKSFLEAHVQRNDVRKCWHWPGISVSRNEGARPEVWTKMNAPLSVGVSCRLKKMRAVPWPVIIQVNSELSVSGLTFSKFSHHAPCTISHCARWQYLCDLYLFIHWVTDSLIQTNASVVQPKPIDSLQIQKVSPIQRRWQREWVKSRKTRA